MDIGVKISGTAHAILISIAIFGAPIFSSDEENPIQISEVSLISLEEFELLTKDNVPVFQSEPELEVQEPEPEKDIRSATRTRSQRGIYGLQLEQALELYLITGTRLELLSKNTGFSE